MALNFNRIDLSRIYPPLLDKLHEISESLGSVDYYATSGFRSFHDQTILYAQGRTTPGPIVTQAQAGYSGHQYGISVDFCRDSSTDQGLQPDWSKEAYEPLADAARTLGLEAGYYWHFQDNPHIQWPIADKWTDLIQISRNGHDIKAVWDYLDSIP